MRSREELKNMKSYRDWVSPFLVRFNKNSSTETGGNPVYHSPKGKAGIEEK